MDISLHILDIAENSIRAGATLIEIELDEKPDMLTVTITDNGVGMTEVEIDAAVLGGYTTKMQSGGRGIRMFYDAAARSGGSFLVESRDLIRHPEDHGTVVKAVFPITEKIPALGDMTETICALLCGIGDGELVFIHRRKRGAVTFDTREVRHMLGDIPIGTAEIIRFLRDHISGQYNDL